jgi:hypothetical protein
MPSPCVSSGSDEAVGIAGMSLNDLSVRELLRELAASEDTLRSHQRLVPDPEATCPNSSRHLVLSRQRALLRELHARRMALPRLGTTPTAAPDAGHPRGVGVQGHGHGGAPE